MENTNGQKFSVDSVWVVFNEGDNYGVPGWTVGVFSTEDKAREWIDRQTLSIDYIVERFEIDVTKND